MPKKAKAANPSREVVPDDYNAVVARAKLRGIRLLSSSFEALPEAYKSDGNERGYEVGYELLAQRYDRTKNQLTGMFAFRASSSTGDDKFLSVEGEYLVDYELSAECEDDAAALFIKRLGPFAAYPYFRALVALLTGQAGLVTPPLPILAEAPRPIERAKNLRLPNESPLAEVPTAKRLTGAPAKKQKATDGAKRVVD